MEIRVLEYFLAVAKEGNISLAAKHLHISQPTLSRQLMDLEEELGVQLFTRGNRSITLTDDGILLKKRAEEITELITKTRSEFLAPSDFISGNVYIGAGETYAMKIVAETIKDVQEEFPNIKFHLFSGNADSVMERLDKGLLDFGILIGPADTIKYDSIALPTTDTWGVLMNKNSELSSKESIKAEDLWEQPLICSSQSLVKNELTKWIKKDYNKLNIVATYNLIYNASLLAEANVGYVLGLDNLINLTAESKLCFKPFKPKLEAKLNVVWKKAQVFSKASEKFLNTLEDKLK